MTKTTDDNLRMPSTADLVAETVDTFETQKCKARIVGLDRGTLISIGIQLIERDIPTVEVWRCLTKEHGEDVCSRSAWFVYAAEFRERFDRVRKAHRNRIARLTVGDATDGQVNDMARMIQFNLVSLMAERVADAQTLENLTGKDQQAMMIMLDNLTRAAQKERELELKADESERKAAKLEEDLKKSELQRRQMLQKIEEYTRQVEETIKSKQSSRTSDKITPEEIAEIRRTVLGM